MRAETITDAPVAQWSRRAAAVVTVAALAACSSGKGGETPSVSASPPTSSPAAEHPVTTKPHPVPTTSKPCKLEGAGNTAALHAKGDVVRLSSKLFGKAVDIAPHTTKGECYEQVTFRFGGPKVSASERPGVRAEYVKTPKKQPSDKPVFVDGKAFLEVTMGSWWGAQGGGEGPTAVASTQTDNIKVAQQTQNFEGVSTWVVGLKEKQPFTVQEVSGTPGCPTECLVLKIQHDEQ